MAGFPNGGGGGGGSVTITSPDGSIDVGGTTSAPTVITDLSQVVRTVNGVAPVAGNTNVTAVPVNLKNVNYISSVPIAGAASPTFTVTFNTFDGVTLAAGQIWLFVGNTNPAFNLAYVVSGSSGSWTFTLSTNFNTQTLLLDAIVNNGSPTNSVNGYAQAQLQTQAPITPGTTALTWTLPNNGIQSNGAENVPAIRTCDFVFGSAAPGGMFSSDLPTGWKGSTTPRRYGVGSTSTTNVSPLCIAFRLYIPEGEVISNLIPLFAVAATTPTHAWCGIADLSLNGLAFTADTTTGATPVIPTVTPLPIATAWNGSAYAAASSFQSAGQDYYFIVVNLAATPATLVATAGSSTLNGISPVVVGQCSNTGSLTAPPTGSAQFNFGTLTAKGPVPFFGWS